MIRIHEAIVVEGRYDRNTISQIIDAPIFETAGFGIFKNKEQLALLRRVAEMRGLIVFTDADGAGLVIRNHLKSAIPAQFLKHAYTPDIFGKERRKATAGKEGKLGVEGMSPEVILEALRRAGATFDDSPCPVSKQLTKQDMAALGLSGGANSSALRLSLQKRLGFPARMSANALLQALNLLYTLEELTEIVQSLEKQDG